jgi:hypothetical protein
METPLNLENLSFILKSQENTKRAYQDNPHYPNYKFEHNRVSEVESIIFKIKKQLKRKKLS